MSQRSAEKRRGAFWWWLALVAVLALTATIRWNFLSIPFERDEGIYAYFGRLVLEGATPYVDFYELKPPLLYYAFALVIAVFGRSVEGVHLGFLAVNLASVCLVFLIGRRLQNELAGIVAAGSLAVLSLAPFTSGFAAQAEHLIVLSSLGGLLLLLRAFERESCAGYFVAAFVATLGLLVKQNGAFFVIALGIGGLAAERLRRPAGNKRLLVRSVAFGAGVLVPCALVGSALAIQGALDEAWFWVYSVPKSYVSEIGLAAGFQYFWTGLRLAAGHDLLFWCAGAAGLVVLAGKRIERTQRIVLAFFIGASLLSIVPGLRFYSHYWILLTPSVALLAGLAFSSAALVVGRWSGRPAWRRAAATLFALLLVAQLALHSDYYFRPDYEAILRRVYGYNPFPEAKVIGDYLRDHTRPEDKIAVIGSEPEIYFYADRHCVSRHAYFAYLVTPYPQHRVWQREFIADVERERPKFVVLFGNQISFPRMPKADLTIVGWSRQFLDRHYQLVGLAITTPDFKTEYIWDASRLAEFRPPRRTSLSYVYLRRLDD